MGGSSTRTRSGRSLGPRDSSSRPACPGRTDSRISRAPRTLSRFAVGLSPFRLLRFAALDAQRGGADVAVQDEGSLGGDAKHGFLSVARVYLGAGGHARVVVRRDRLWIPTI